MELRIIKGTLLSNQFNFLGILINHVKINYQDHYLLPLTIDEVMDNGTFFELGIHESL